MAKELSKSVLNTKLLNWINQNNSKEIIYKVYDNRYYVPCNIENIADNIHYDDNPSNLPTDNYKGYKGFRGYGGREIPFKLEDGTIKIIKGPWHTNSETLYNDIKLDIRNKHLTIGCLFLDRCKSILNNFTNVIYVDEEPVIGDYDRIKNMAIEYSKKYKQTIYYYMKSATGGIESYIEYNE